jgi:hypothetical protein
MITTGQMPDQGKLIKENYRLATEFSKYFVYENGETGLLINKNTNAVEFRYHRS